MHFSLRLLALAVAATAAPLQRRALSANDITVLQLANYLENLEHALYGSGAALLSQAQASSEGFPSDYIAEIALVAEQEQTHIDTLVGVLQANGQSGVPGCEYDFPYSDVMSFAKLALGVTSVGISAYSGAAELLADNSVLLTSASSILPVEARHDAANRLAQGMLPFPGAFDTPQPGLFAYSLAQQFIVSCPQQLSFNPLPLLANGNVVSGAQQFYYSCSVDTTKSLYIAWINTANPPQFVPASSCGANCIQAAIPAGLTGATFPVLTSNSAGTADALAEPGASIAVGEVIIN